MPFPNFNKQVLSPSLSECLGLLLELSEMVLLLVRATFSTIIIFTIQCNISALLYSHYSFSYYWKLFLFSVSNGPVTVVPYSGECVVLAIIAVVLLYTLE